MAMTRKRLWLASGVLAAGLLLAGVIYIAVFPSGSEPPPRSQFVDDIREAVFRYQFVHNNRGLRGVDVFFLALGQNTDPSQEFLKRFAGHTPPVKPVSACRIDPLRGVFDKDTGKGGLVFRVEGIAWVNDKKVEVEGGYYRNGLAASGNVYTVESKSGKWVVVGDKMLWIS